MQVLNNVRVLRLLKQFRSLGPEYQRRAFLETAAASVLIEALPRAINTYTTYGSMAKALERAGTLSRQTERKQLLTEYGELLGFLETAKDGSDPWLEINHFARNALERTWNWLVTLREGSFPGELLPFDFIHKMIALKKTDWPKLNREAKSNSLRQFGKRDEDGLTVLLNGRTVQVAKIFKNLQAEDLQKIVEWKSGLLDALDKRLLRQGKALLRAAKESKLVEAQPIWEELWESWKTYKAPEGQTLIRVPPWLTEDKFIARVAKGLAKILEIVGKVPIDILEPAWARVLGAAGVNTVPLPYDPFPKIRKVAPDLDKLCPEWYKTTKIFRRQEMSNYCAIIGCAHGPVGDFNICSAHLATLADMLEQSYDVSPARPAPFPAKSEKTWQSTGKPRPMSFVSPFERALVIRDALVLHNPRSGLTAPPAQLIMAQMRMYKTGTEIEWGDPLLWKNLKLLEAIEKILSEYDSRDCFEPYLLLPIPAPIITDMPRIGSIMEFEAGPLTEEDIACSRTPFMHLVERPPLHPTMGDFVTIKKGSAGMAVVFKIAESVAGVRMVEEPVILVRQGGMVESFKLSEIDKMEGRAFQQATSLMLADAFLAMTSRATIKNLAGRAPAYQELEILHKLATQNHKVQFVAHFSTVSSLQKAKEYWIRWAIAKKLSDHSRLALTSVGSHPCEDLELPDMFFMARSGRHCKAWRPVSFGNSGPLVLEPTDWAQKQELDFFALFVLSTKFEAGLTVENLLGPVSESLETHTYILRDALRKRAERGVAILAFILELNDLALLDKLEISGGQASFCPQGSVKMEMPARSWGRLKSGNWSQAKDFLLDARNSSHPLQENIMPSRNVIEWIRRYLPKNRRYEQTLGEAMFRSWKEFIAFPIHDENDLISFFEKFFGERTGEQVIPAARAFMYPIKATCEHWWRARHRPVGEWAGPNDYERIIAEREGTLDQTFQPRSPVPHTWTESEIAQHTADLAEAEAWDTEMFDADGNYISTDEEIEDQPTTDPEASEPLSTTEEALTTSEEEEIVVNYLPLPPAEPRAEEDDFARLEEDSFVLFPKFIVFDELRRQKVEKMEPLTLRKSLSELTEEEVREIGEVQPEKRVEIMMVKRAGPSNLNLSVERNTRSDTNPTPDVVTSLSNIPLLNPPLEDMERLMEGLAPRSIWAKDGAVFVPHRSARKVKFVSEVEEHEVMSDQAGDSDEEGPAGPGVEAKNRPCAGIPLVEMKAWGKVAKTAGQTAPKETSRRRRTPGQRYKQERDVNRDCHADKLLRQIGITSTRQLVKAENIDITQSEEEIKEILEAARMICCLAPDLSHRRAPAADKLCRLILESPLSVTQILAYLAEENGELRTDIIRQAIRQALARANKKVGALIGH
ncbi:unnamed protein product [Oikopleura dioica]|uniref:Uncharacterized protein n=1 Tax=Oikopleura dioica TaxID=34765 RepID=E4WQI1_OIKDI|nr:unnamed protein product [Oikopleura dioica]